VPVEESAETHGGTPNPELTGDRAVDAVLSGLSAVAEAPVGEHAALYTGLHDGLLAALNEETGLAAGPPPGVGSMSGPASARAPHPGQGSA